MARKESRPARWARAASAASEALSSLREALEELEEVRTEYEEWKDGLPENLASSSLGDKLETVCGIDLEGALSDLDTIEEAISEAEGADLPQGFGRD